MSNQISQELQRRYDQVFQNGKLFNIHIGMWGMSTTLEEADIKLNNQLPETHILGKKMLIKPEVYAKFKTQEQRLRNHLRKNSHNFAIAKAYFVPKNMCVKVFSELEKLKEEYMQMVDEFIEKYEDYKQQALAFYEQNKDVIKAEDIEKLYPTVEKIRDKFYCHVVAYEISMPREYAQINLQEAIAREEIENTERSRAESRYREEFNQQAQLHLNQIDDFVEKSVTALRSSVAEFCTVVLGKIDEKEIVSDTSIKKLFKHIKEFREMDFVGDKAVQEKLDAVEKVLNSDLNFSKDKDAVGLLQQCLTNVVKQASSVSDVANISGEYFRKLSV